MAAGKLISRDELLGGFHGGDKRRAAIALSLIQARAARIRLQRGSVNAPYMTESAFAERNLAFLGAIAEGAKSTVKVSIQDLERSAPEWQVLVPKNPGTRAEIARLIGEAYRFSSARVPKLAKALGLDDPEVQAAFESHHGRPLSTIYRTGIAPGERLRWAWMGFSDRLEALPPFWTAFALTLTETVGAGTLALPVAFATVGPTAGAVLLILVGLINVLTVGYLAEASARNGSILYGSAFIGQLVRDFLSPFAVLVVRFSLFCFCCIVLVAYYTGFSTTLGGVTGLPDFLWVFLVFGVGVFLILRKSLIGTVASALLIGFVNITILVILSLTAFGHASWERLGYVKVPFLHGEPFDASLLQLVFGIAMTSYFGHVSVSNCAQAVLRREPDGHSLKRGTMAAMVVAIAIYILWAVAIGGAIDAERLASEKGTVLIPLAEKVGPGVNVLGTVFVILALGMGSVHFSLGIFNMARELIASGRLASSSGWGQKLARAKGVTSFVALVPILAVFTYVQWSHFTDKESFIKPLELIGVLLTPILAGIIPVLLLIASRKRGRDATGAKLSAVISNPLVVGFLGVLFFASLILHGTVIWEDPLQQGLALLVAAMALICVVGAVRRDAFAPQWLIEVRHFPEDSDRAEVAVAFKGKAVLADLVVQLADGTERKLRSDGALSGFGTCRSLTIELPARPAANLEIAAHKISGDFEADPIAGTLSDLRDGEARQAVALDGRTGRTKLAAPKGPQRWQLQLP